MNGKQQTTQTVSTQPGGPALPHLTENMRIASAYRDSGVGYKPYNTSMVTPFSQQTKDAQNMAGHVANQGYEQLSGNMTRMERLAGEDGLSDLQRESVDQLAPMASGEMLVKNNPFTEAVVNRTADVMSHQISDIADLKGRFGSPAHQGIVAREVGDMANRAFMQDYNRERGYMQDAIGSRYNAGQQQRQNKIADNDAIFTAYQHRLAPSQTLFDLGAQHDDLKTRQINDRARIFSENDMAQWNRLLASNAAIGGNGAIGSTQTHTAPAPSRAQSMFGGALAGSSLGPWGALGGAALGGFF